MSSSTAPDEKPLSATLLGYRIDLGTIASLKSALLTQASAKQVHVVTVNPEIIMRGQQDEAYAELVKNADCCLPDGAGVVWALKQQGLKQPRLPGIEFADTLLATAAEQQWPVVFVGGKPGVVDKAVERMTQRFNGLSVAYSHHGYFASSEEEAEVKQAAAAVQPKLVLVALGVPRQDFWIAESREQFPPGTIFVGVGGSFDVWSGTLQRAPGWLRAIHCEWAYRFWQEPWRIRRSVPPILRFVWQVLNNKES